MFVGIGATIHTRRDIQCLPSAGFFFFLTIWFKSSEMQLNILQCCTVYPTQNGSVLAKNLLIAYYSCKTEFYKNQVNTLRFSEAHQTAWYSLWSLLGRRVFNAPPWPGTSTVGVRTTGWLSPTDGWVITWVINISQCTVMGVRSNSAILFHQLFGKWESKILNQAIKCFTDKICEIGDICKVWTWLRTAVTNSVTACRCKTGLVTGEVLCLDCTVIHCTTLCSVLYWYNLV